MLFLRSLLIECPAGQFVQPGDASCAYTCPAGKFVDAPRKKCIDACGGNQTADSTVCNCKQTYSWNGTQCTCRVGSVEQAGLCDPVYCNNRISSDGECVKSCGYTEHLSSDGLHCLKLCSVAFAPGAERPCISKCALLESPGLQGGLCSLSWWRLGILLFAVLMVLLAISEVI